MEHLCHWGSATFVHFASYPHWKLGSMANKCIFLQYSKESKSYIFIWENEYGTRIEIKLHNANFLGHGLPIIGEMSKDIELFEGEDQLAPTDEGNGFFDQ